MTTREVARINVAFPAPLVAEMEKYIPRGERNRFIVEAAEKELRRVRLRDAIRDSAGAWSAEDHPDLITPEDVDRYVRRLRETAMPRTWDEIAGESDSSG